jgi:hypothetical protein
MVSPFLSNYSSLTVKRYKKKGLLKTDDGKTDCMELYSINQDDMLGNLPVRRNADPIEARRAQVRKFIEHSHSIIGMISCEPNHH